MARKRRASSFIDGFNAGYDTVDKLHKDYQAGQVQREMKDGMKKAQQEADESGMQYLDSDGKGGLDYRAKDKATIDMIAEQEDFINEKPGLAPIKPVTGETQLADASAAEAGAPAAPESNLAALTARPPAPEMTKAPTAVAGLERVSAAPPPLDAGAGPAAPAADPAQPGYTRGEKPKLDAMDIFHKKYAPNVVKKLMEQGKQEEAMKFEDWTRGAQGKAYGNAWMKAVQAEQAGDHDGAMMAVQDLYNKQMPDGRYAIAKPGKDGTYSIEVRDEKSNKVVQQFAGKAPDLTQALLGMGSPDKVYSHLHSLEQAAIAKRDEIAKEDRKFERDKMLEGIKAGNVSPSDLAKYRRERDRLAAENPNHPDLAHYDRAIANVGTKTPPMQFSMGSSPTGPGGNQLVVTGKDGKTAYTVQVPGLPDKRDEEAATAASFMSGYSYQPVVKGGPPMLHRQTPDGKWALASSKEESDYAEAQAKVRAAEDRRKREQASSAGLK